MDRAISMFSMFGLIALAGVVVNDSLIMIDFVNKARIKGVAIRQAVIESGTARFRAIILTSVTTAAGLMPILLESSSQAQFVIPTAISISFGIIFATIITLFLIPSLYMLQEDFFARARQFKRWMLSQPHPDLMRDGIDALRSVVTELPNQSSEIRDGVIAGLLAYVMWGFLPVYFKIVGSVNPLEVLSHRVIWAVPLGAAILFARRQWPEVRRALTHRSMLGWLSLSALFIALNWFVYIWAIQDERIFETSLGYYINPLTNMLSRHYPVRGKAAAIATARGRPRGRWCPCADHQRRAGSLGGTVSRD